MPSKDHIAEFLDHLLSEARCSPLTVEAYRRDLRQFFEFCSDSTESPDADHATPRDIRAWIGTLADQGNEAATLRRKLQSLRAFYKYGMKTGRSGHNPARDVTLPKKKKRLPGFIKEQDMEEILSECGDTFESMRRHIATELIYTLGLRRAEVLALTDADVHARKAQTGEISEAGEIRITGKRNKTRILPLPFRLSADIVRWQQIRDERYPQLQPPRPLIAGPHGSISANTLHNIVRDALSGTSSSKKSPHTLRHTFATTMINNGADLDAVREILGHASLSTTQIYTHLSVNELMAGYRLAHPRGALKPKS